MFCLVGKSITPLGSRATRPSTVARFISVSVIASGIVKLVFNSVMTACRSAGANELTISPVVGLAEGEGDADAAGFGEAAVLPGGIPIGGVCAKAPIARNNPIKSKEMN